MPYFNELPNIRYGAGALGSSSNGDVVLVKNLFRRAKLREDMVNAATAFQYYQIQDNERPDQIAKKAYDDANLDWVVLITNNITNINEQWPLDNESFYKYLLDKYGSDEEIQAVRHTETLKVTDEYDRLVVPEKIITDKDLTQDVVVGAGGGLDYILSSFPVANGILPLKITITLGDYFPVWDRPSQDAGVYIAPEYAVTDITLKNKRNDIIHKGIIQGFSYSATDTTNTGNYIGVIGTTNGSGDIAAFDVERNIDGKVINVKIQDAASEYEVGDTITLLGSEVGGANITDDIQITITSILEDRSTLNIYERNGRITDVPIPNSLNGFPSTWGGSTVIYGRDDETTVFAYGWVSDPINIAGDTRLYSIAGETIEDTNTIIPIFRFKSIGVAPL
jgi:hypothetical protein